MNIEQFWADVLRQDADAIREYFRSDAQINWHNTNERFGVDEFIRANCEYPGEWDGEVERIIYADDCIITVTHVHSMDGKLSFHATSFIRLLNDKIACMDEYRGDDGDAPQWRKDMHIGSRIK